MSNFIKLRLILQQSKPDLNDFLQKLQEGQIQKEDLDLLLRKTVESKLPQFGEFADALIRKGANLNFYDSKGTLPSHRQVCLQPHFRYLEPQLDSISNLMLACEKGTFTMVETLLRYKELDLLHRDSRQLHAGFYAVENKRAEEGENILRILILREPAIVNQEAGNQILLTAAIRRGKHELVKLLLQNNGDPNWQVPDTGNSSLHDAVKQIRSKPSKSNAEIIRLLLLHGANTTLKNKQLKTVYEYAEKSLAEYQKIEDSVRQYLLEQQQKVVTLLSINGPDDVFRVMHEAQAIFEKYEETEEAGEEFLEQKDMVDQLTVQIQEFERECRKEYEWAQKDISPFMAALGSIAQKEGLSVEVYGSFATGLWVKQSNIDIQLITMDNPPKDILDQVAESLKKHSICKSIAVISRSGRLPHLRCQLERNRIISIILSYPNSPALANVIYLRERLSVYPDLRPIFLVVKTLSCYFRLSQYKSGGIRTYALAIMLLSCISAWNKNSLGKFLIDFLFYFGFYYNYHNYDYLPSNREETQDDSMSLRIIDPLHQDLGRVWFIFRQSLTIFRQDIDHIAKNVRAGDLQKMFRAAYIAAHSNTDGGRLRLMFDTRKILL